MRVGFAAVDITPPVGTWMSGYGGRGASEAVHDALELSAAAWTDDGGRTAIIVGADVLGYDYEFVAAARGSLAKQYGLEPDAVLLNGSHTHGGPAIINHLVIEAPHIDAGYRQRVLDAVGEAVGAALDARREATVQYGFGRCAIGINRRAPGPPYQMMPNPRGFYDATVGVLAFCEPGNRKPFGVLFNASCHPTTLGAMPAFSADWPGAARRALERDLGDGTRAIFLQAACGNIRPRTFDLADPTRFRQGTVAEFTRMGEACAHEVLRILADGLRTAEGALRIARVACELPLEQQPTRAELEAMLGNNDPFQPSYARYTLDRWGDDLPTTLPYEAQLISVGEQVGLLAMPGEVVSELGWAARRTVPWPVLYCGYSNGLPCYVPNARIRRQGGYEAGLRSNEFFGLPGWLKQESELVMLGAVEQAVAGVRAGRPAGRLAPAWRSCTLALQ